MLLVALKLAVANNGRVFWIYAIWVFRIIDLRYYTINVEKDRTNKNQDPV